MNIRHFRLPDVPDTRKCNGPEDWGDILTIGKHLKKRNIKGLGKDDDFGIYLGLNEVGVKSNDERWYVKEKIKYASEEEMKEIWILD